MRDDDMLETMEAEKYPFAGFYGKLVSDFDPGNREPQQVTVKGEMTIHGVTKPFEITGTLQKTDEGLKVKADWIINMKDYDIKPPGILFYRVSEKIDVSISATLPPLTNS
jgi:polyisoprenoid-binding protein YceI